tara:strand:+ start:336 stop:710 length:375 start_codon:yes stop_codon:yes gene_type:complete
MKYFNSIIIFSIILLISNFAVAEKPVFNLFKDKIPYGITIPVEISLSCGSTETFIDQLITPANKESIFGGISTENIEKFIYEIFYNNDSQSFILAQHFAIGNTCVLGVGKLIRLKTPFNKNDYN